MPYSEPNPSGLDEDALLALAPTDLPIYRPDRYDGGGIDAYLDDFVGEDPERIRAVHDSLQSTYQRWLEIRTEADWTPLHHEVRSLSEGRFEAITGKLGHDTHDSASPKLLKVLHDLRGGALAAFVLEASLLTGPDDRAGLRNAAFFARDHAKMMRNAVIDVAPDLRKADEEEQAHPVRDLLDKWNERRYGEKRGGIAEVHVDCRTNASVADRCLEASAVDRVLYNLVNNAVQHTADGSVHVRVLHLDGGAVRIVVANRVDEDQARWLRETATNGGLARLFDGGVTRGGSGLGLSTVAEFVASAFGVTVEEAMDHGYLGAKLTDHRFLGWIHWPLVGTA